MTEPKQPHSGTGMQDPDEPRTTTTEREAATGTRAGRTTPNRLALATLIVWVATLGVAYVGVGGYLSETIEGVDPALRSPAPLWLAGLGLVVAAVLSLSWVDARTRVATNVAGRGVARRRFILQGLGTLTGGLAATTGAILARNRGWLQVTAPNVFLPQPPTESPVQKEAWKESRIESYRRLGRTEARVSDISLGSAAIHPARGGEEIARAALDRGVNYFDTAPDYAETGSEVALGRAMQGRRDSVFLATKFCTPSGHVAAGSGVDTYIRAVEGSLRRLQTDHVDLVHIHSCDSVERLMDPDVHEAFDRLREQGKARFLGVSTHTPNLERVANEAIASGRFDVMMLAYHHGAWPGLADIIDRAAAADIGIVAMKTLKGARHESLAGFSAERDSYPQAAFRWVLSNPSVAALVISFRKPQHVDEYLAASGQRQRPGDHAILQKYDRLIAGVHCFQHCGACLSACPEQVPIDDVLRYRMYFEDYGEQREAMRLYSLLQRNADVCAQCSGPCLGACPVGLSIPERTRTAHVMLS